MSQEIGNEQNLAKVREMMAETANELNLGEKSTNGVLINFTSEYGKLYQGSIVFKRPSVMDFMSMGGIKSEVLRKAGVQDVKLVDNGVKYMAQIIATLKTVVVKCPEWLINVDAVTDMDLLFHVHGKYEDWERSFRSKATADDFEGVSKTT